MCAAADREEMLRLRVWGYGCTQTGCAGLGGDHWVDSFICWKLLASSEAISGTELAQSHSGLGKCLVRELRDGGKSQLLLL